MSITVKDGAGVSQTIRTTSYGSELSFVHDTLKSGALPEPFVAQMTAGAVWDATGDYSSAATEFTLAPSAGTVYRVERLLIEIQDGSGMRASRYGTLASALTNGVEVQKRESSGDTTLVDFTAGHPIKTNAGWGRLCGVDVDIKSWGSGDDVLVARFTFERAGGFPLRLDGDASEYLTVTLNDNMTGIVSQVFTVQGYIED